MINWPAILKYAGDDELTFISSQAEWNSDADLHFSSYEADDILIDSKGLIHSLAKQQNNIITPVPTHIQLSQAEVIAHIQAHLSVMGACCVSKISALPIKQAIAMVGASNEK